MLENAQIFSDIKSMEIFVLILYYLLYYIYYIYHIYIIIF